MRPAPVGLRLAAGTANKAEGVDASPGFRTFRRVIQRVDQDFTPESRGLARRLGCMRIPSLDVRRYCLHMTSPGPGWWQASDGKWYPQQWEYTWLTSGAYKFLKEAVEYVTQQAAAYGIQGWEMVNYTVEYHGSQGSGSLSHSGGGDQRLAGVKFSYGEWMATAILKRPVAPG